MFIYAWYNCRFQYRKKYINWSFKEQYFPICIFNDLNQVTNNSIKMYRLMTSKRQTGNMSEIKCDPQFSVSLGMFSEVFSACSFYTIYHRKMQGRAQCSMEYVRLELVIPLLESSRD